MDKESLVDEFRRKLDKPLRQAFSKISDDNRIRDLLIEQLQDRLARSESQNDLLLSILKAQDERIRRLESKEALVSEPQEALTFEESEAEIEEKPVEIKEKMHKISKELDFFAKHPLSPAQRWIIDQVADLQKRNKNQPVLAKIVQEMFYADRPDIKSKRHAFYHHISRCIDAKKLVKIVAGNQMYLFVPVEIIKEVQI